MRGEIRILHTSDVHLDAGFRATGLPSARARERCQAHLDAFDWIVDAVERLQVDLLCIAGDLFEGAHARPQTVRHVARRLGACGRPVFIAPGNHDALQQRSVYDLAAWPQNIVIFGSGWQSVPLPDLDCVVHGRGFTEAEEHARLVEGLVVTGAGRHVLVAHGSDESNRPERHDPYRPFLPTELDAWPLAYAALGHYHRFSVLATRHGRAVYSGCPIPQNFADTEVHGVVLARLGDAGTEVELVPVPARAFVTLAVDVSGADTHASLVQRLQEAVGAGARASDYVRVRLQGSLPPDLEVDIEALRASLVAHAHEVQVRDETVPEYDLDALAQEATVRGQFVRTLSERLRTAAAAEEDVVLRALHLGLDAFSGRPQRH